MFPFSCGFTSICETDCRYTPAAVENHGLWRIFGSRISHVSPKKPAFLAVAENDLNVKSAEDLIRRMKVSSDRSTPGTPIAVAAQNAVIRDIQNKISTRLNASVEIKHTPKRGKIVITYLGNDDLQRILDTLGVKI